MDEITIIRNGLILTLDQANRIFEDGAVAIQGDKILAVGKTDEITKQYKGDDIIDAKKKMVMPGLIDLHYHTSIGRGVSDGLSLDDALFKFWYPKVREVNAREAYWAALCGYSEAIKSGTTCVNDQWRQMFSCAEAAEEIGIRAVLSCDVADEEEKLDTWQDNEKLYREKHNAADGRIKVFFGIEWLPIASKELMIKTRELANKYGTGIHVHLNEGEGELQVTKQRHGMRPVELANHLGILGSDCVAAHCVFLTDDEIRMLRDSHSSVAHCPKSNAKVGNGIARVPELLRANVNVGLGHDSATANNTLDIFEEMKWASLLQRAVTRDARSMPAKVVLEMATKNGGNALRLPIGFVRAGNKADLILLDLNTQHFTPLVLGQDFNLLSNLVYAADGRDVVTSIVNGRIIMQDRVLKIVDESKIIEKANESFRSLYQRLDKTWRRPSES